MHLAENIRNYYFAHLSELTDEKQFHLCTRLASWNDDKQALAKLAAMKHLYVPTPCTRQELVRTLMPLIAYPPPMPANAAALRNTYFEKYPWLRGLELGMFRVRHLMAIYDIDARPALFDIVSRQELIAHKNELLDDPEGIRILSTYAVNYLYVLEREILQNPTKEALDVEALYELGEGYDPQDPIHLQLYTYLYTHCIIAESGFYARVLPESLLGTYTKMLRTLEPIIKTNFGNLSLDTKLEFLVCCRICGYDTDLEKTIYDECEKSVSPEGTFLVDTQNNFAAKSHKKSLDASEHRNALFIMSTIPYTPHRIAV